MSKDPEKLDDPKLRAIRARRGFFGQAALAAANPLAAAAESVKPEAKKITPDILESLKKSQELLNVYSNPGRWSMTRDLTTPSTESPSELFFDPEYLKDAFAREQVQIRALKSHFLPKIRTMRSALREKIGATGIFYPKGEFLKAAIDDNGILQPAAVDAMFAKLEQQHIDYNKERESLLPHAMERGRKIVNACKKLKEAYQRSKQTNGCDNFREFVRKSTLNVPKDGDWTEHFSNPANIEAAVQSLDDKNNPNEMAYRQSKRERRETRRQGEANQLGKFFERLVQKDDDYFYVESPAPSPELYAALRNVLTLRDESAYFPRMEELFAAKIEKGEGVFSWAPVDVRLPPDGYVLRLSEDLAEKLDAIVTGNLDLRSHPKDGAIVTLKDSGIAYRTESEKAKALSEDIEHLQTLLKEKWTSQASTLGTKHHQR
jgi:hypothetical protein